MSKSGFVSLPDGSGRKNGGVECVMAVGPCACGAWHEEQSNQVQPIPGLQNLPAKSKEERMRERGRLSPTPRAEEEPKQVQAPEEAPIPCTMYCPFCGALHVDEGEWATRPHHKHLCQHCGKLWRVEPYCYGVDPGPRDPMQYDYAHGVKAGGQ